MRGHDSNTPAATSSSTQNAHEYSVHYSFKALHLPNIEILVRILQEHQDYGGFLNKIALLLERGQKYITSPDFWDPLAKKAVIAIKVCITTKRTN